MELQFKPATNLDEAIINFTSIKDLNEDKKEFYVELYESLKKKLVLYLTKQATENLSILISGQIQTGKTTFLNFLLIEQAIKEKFYIRNVKIDKYISLTSRNIDIYDVCFSLALDLSYDVIERFDDFSIQKIILHKLQTYYSDKTNKQTFCINETTSEKVLDSAVKEVGETLGNITKKIFGLNVENIYRSLFKNQFINNEAEFNNYFSEIITKYKNIILKNNSQKEILIIIDQLEKNTFPEAIQNVFGELNLLKSIPIKKIIVSPIYATLLNMNLDANIISFNILPKKNPSDNEIKVINQNYNFLKEIFFKRIDANFKILYEEEILDKIIYYSGGNIGQFFNIIAETIIQSLMRNSNQINNEDLDNALTTILSKLAMHLSFNGFPKQFLIKLMDEKEDFSKEDFLKSATFEEKQKFNSHLLNNIFFINNGRNPIVIVNPILKPYIYGVDGWDIK